jgi:hypothetical protein
MATFFLFSCSDDNSGNDDNSIGESGTTVKYVVTATAPVITGIEYRLPNGTYDEVSSPDSDWSQTIAVERPFNASLFAHFMNNTTSTQDYTLSIYVNNQLMRTVEGHVAPSSSVNDSAVLDVPAQSN